MKNKDVIEKWRKVIEGDDYKPKEKEEKNKEEQKNKEERKNKKQ